MIFILPVLESILLVISLSTDAFAASLAYGAGGIKIPFRSALLLSAICSGMLGLSMLMGGLLGGFIPSGVAQWIGFWLLLGMGLLRLFENWMKSYIRRHNRIRVKLCANDLRFILTVYADVENADCDSSKLLSTQEAIALAVVLSLDSLAVGLGTALAGFGWLLPVGLSLALTLGAVYGGCALGRWLPCTLPIDFSILSALLLVVLALTRLTP